MAQATISVDIGICYELMVLDAAVNGRAVRIVTLNVAYIMGTEQKFGLDLMTLEGALKRIGPCKVRPPIN